MEKYSPNTIKDYYVAYMDILGYKAFFNEHSEEIPRFLERIDKAIKRTVEHINITNTSPIVKNLANICIESKVFSDNILLCMEVTKSPFECMRVLLFLQVISDIQRGFITDHGLFLRGGVKRGSMSINNDYVFGQGLIDVVEMEEKIAIYPRVVVDEDIAKYVIGNNFCTQTEIIEANRLMEAINNQLVSDEDMKNNRDLLFRVHINGCVQSAACNLIWQWDDGLFFVNYLLKIDPNQMFGNSIVEESKKILKTISPYDYEIVTQPSKEQDLYLLQNKIRIEEQLRYYGHNNDIDITDGGNAFKQAESRERILKKYIWAMAYHNRFCERTNKLDFFINTVCNCDTRFLRTVVDVKDYIVDKGIKMQGN